MGHEHDTRHLTDPTTDWVSSLTDPNMVDHETSRLDDTVVIPTRSMRRKQRQRNTFFVAGVLFLLSVGALVTGLHTTGRSTALLTGVQDISSDITQRVAGVTGFEPPSSRQSERTGVDPPIRFDINAVYDSTQTGIDGPLPYVAQSGNRVIILDLTITNQGSSEYRLPAVWQTVSDASGRSYAPAQGAVRSLVGHERSWTVSVSPDASQRGVLVYEIPRDAVIQGFTFRATPESEGVFVSRTTR